MDIAILRHYASIGLHLHPLKVLGKTPLFKGWADDATTDMHRIELWLDSHPQSNWGAVTGQSSNITVVDIDPRHGGDKTWAALVAKHGEPKAPKSLTARGGFHYYFKHFLGVYKFGPGIEILSYRNNVVLPPSVTADGSYDWLNGLPTAFPQAPAWLRKAAKAGEGTRNDDAYKKACNLFRDGATLEAVLEQILAEFGDEDDKTHNEELRKTVGSAEQRATASRRAFQWNGADPEDFDEFLASDLGNARLLIKHIGNDIRLVRDTGWVVYDGTRWQFDDNRVYQKYMEIMDYQREHYRIASERTNDSGAFKELQARERHFTTSTNNRVAENSLKTTQSDANFAINLATFDSERTAHLLNFPNGTVDLRTGILHPHNRDDFITKICSADYDAGAKAPFWDETLGKIFGGDAELISYIQMMLGASIMGSQDTRTLFIAYGKSGKNGKSTLFETLAEILGDYADHAELRMLASTDTGNLTELTTRMRIRGARLVLSSEMSSADYMDANMIKRLTGGDTISARSMFKATVTFRPVCSIWLRTNLLPAIRGADNAFWERICIIPFDYRFEGNEQLDARVVMERFKEEAPGILSWLVKGAVSWNTRNGGFAVPQRVQELRTMYMSDIDNFADFISDALRKDGASAVKVPALHRTYSDFCKRRGVPAPSLSAFKQDLRSASLLSIDGKEIKGYAISTDYASFEL